MKRVCLRLLGLVMSAAVVDKLGSGFWLVWELCFMVIYNDLAWCSSELVVRHLRTGLWSTHVSSICSCHGIQIWSRLQGSTAETIFAPRGLLSTWQRSRASSVVLQFSRGSQKEVMCVGTAIARRTRPLTPCRGCCRYVLCNT